MTSKRPWMVSPTISYITRLSDSSTLLWFKSINNISCYLTEKLVWQRKRQRWKDDIKTKRLHSVRHKTSVSSNHKFTFIFSSSSHAVEFSNHYLHVALWLVSHWHQDEHLHCLFLSAVTKKQSCLVCVCMGNFTSITVSVKCCQRLSM